MCVWCVRRRKRKWERGERGQNIYLRNLLRLKEWGRKSAHTDRREKPPSYVNMSQHTRGTRGYSTKTVQRKAWLKPAFSNLLKPTISTSPHAQCRGIFCSSGRDASSQTFDALMEPSNIGFDVCVCMGMRAESRGKGLAKATLLARWAT